MQDRVPASQPSDCIARARSIARELARASSRIEAERAIGPDLMQMLHEARLFRMSLPKSLGGDEASLADMAEVTQVIAAADGSSAWCVGQAAGCAMTAAQLEPSAARRVFGPADAVLAWGAGAQGKAVPDKKGWRIEGRWSFASGSRGATWLGAHCKIFDTAGAAVLRPDGRHLELTFLVPRSEAKIIDDWNVMGLRGTGSDSYALSDHWVASELAADREDQSGRFEAAPLYKFPQIMIYAGGFAGVMLGIARGMLDDLFALAQSKTPRGAASSLKESPVFQSQLAQLEARHRAARSYLMGTLRSAWTPVAAGGPLTTDIRVDVRLASTFTINEALQIAVEAYRAAGQHAIFTDNTFERRMRDALSASQQVQGRPSHFVTVGRHMMGLGLDSAMFI